MIIFKNRICVDKVDKIQIKTKRGCLQVPQICFSNKAMKKRKNHRELRKSTGLPTKSR